MENCNYGVFFGFLEGSVWIIPLNGGLFCLILFFLSRAKKRLEKAGWSLLSIGGGLNLAERLYFGCVTDYWQPIGFWPSFNLADILIFFGALIVILSRFQYSRR